MTGADSGTTIRAGVTFFSRKGAAYWVHVQAGKVAGHSRTTVISVGYSTTHLECLDTFGCSCDRWECGDTGHEDYGQAEEGN